MFSNIITALERQAPTLKDQYMSQSMPNAGLTIILFVMLFINREAFAKLETDLPNAYNYAWWDFSLYAYYFLTMLYMS